MEILIFANGENGNIDELKPLINRADYIIAADGGGNHCSELGITPDLLIGDLDSIKPELLESYKDDEVEIQRHPPRKDATDLELAMELALQKKAERLWLIGALGKRWDMSLANIFLAAANKYKSCKISLVGQDCSMHILHPSQPYILKDSSGQIVSLIPLHADARGVTLTGFEYPLQNHTIQFGSSLGISNVVISTKASIQHSSGVLLCIQETKEE